MKFTRQQIWRHNGLLGSTRMAYLAMQAVMTVPTTTDESRELAHIAQLILSKLAQSLKTRIDKKEAL